MADLDLDAIEARANAAMLSPTGQQYDAGVVLSTDVPALVAEVRSLRTMRDAAWQHYDEQVAAKERAALEERDEALRHLTHAAAVEAALTSDLLAAHVEVEQLRVTRATDRNRLRHTRKALAKTRLLLEIRAEQTERLLTDIARVRALCARALNGWEEADTRLCEAEEGRWSAPGIEQVRDELAALDVRHDPSATTDGGAS